MLVSYLQLNTALSKIDVLEAAREKFQSQKYEGEFLKKGIPGRVLQLENRGYGGSIVRQKLI